MVHRQDDISSGNGEGMLCAVPELPERRFDLDINPNRAGLIRMSDKKWVNGTTLNYWFFDGPPEEQDAVRRAFLAWKGLGIGLEFVEAADASEAEIRIGFVQTDGSWSYIGRDSIDFVSDPSARTMNFGWSLLTPYGWDTALHEIGHALGFPHEHQNPNSGIVWDEEAVLREFGGPPNNWSRQQIDFNILRKLPLGSVVGSDWDANSIMHYTFGPGLIQEPVEYGQRGLFPAPGLSETDIEHAKKFYPEQSENLVALQPLLSKKGVLEPGEQVDFLFIPDATRQYTFRTLGEMDCVMVLSRRDDEGSDTFMAGDDDSGFNRNAHISKRLEKDKKYVLRIRMYYSNQGGEFGVVVW